MHLIFPPVNTLTAVTFDLDGLIVNSEDIYIQVGEATLAKRGKSFDTDLREQMMGRPAEDAVQTMIDWHQLEETVDQLLEESEATFWELAATSLRPMPGFEVLLEQLLNASIPCGVATSGGRDYAHKVLKRLGIFDHFQFVITANDVDNGKPAPEPYLKAAKQHDVAADRMLVLEDSANGCRAGVAAGAYTVAVPNNHTQDHPFHGVAFVAETLGDPRLLRTVGLAH